MNFYFVDGFEGVFSTPNVQDIPEGGRKAKMSDVDKLLKKWKKQTQKFEKISNRIDYELIGIYDTVEDDS